MATITEDYVSFEIAKLLKEKGFHCRVKNYYFLSKESVKAHHEKKYGAKKDWNSFELAISRPSQSLVMKWLREVYNIFIQISAVLQDQPFGLHYIPSIQDYHAYARHDNFSEYVTYEEAVEAALNYTLENLI